MTKDELYREIQRVRTQISSQQKQQDQLEEKWDVLLEFMAKANKNFLVILFSKKFIFLILAHYIYLCQVTNKKMSRSSFYLPCICLSIASAAALPAPIARITVAAPVTASPPA